MGKRIREFLRDLFGSRLVEQLELDLLRLRQDFESRLQDKDLMIASLREEKALLNSKVALYEMTIMPRSSRVGAEVVAYQKPAKPNFAKPFMEQPMKSRWELYQEEYYKEQEAAEKAEKEEAAVAAKG